MEFWNWDTFLGEFAVPVLVASAILGLLGMIARWLWRRNRTVFAYGVLWLMALVFIGFVFMALHPKSSQESTRPYFTKSESSIYFVTDDDGEKTSNMFLTVSIQNNDRPVKNITHHLILLDERLDPTRKPLRTKRVRNANDVGRYGMLNRHTPVNVGMNTRSAYVVFEIMYTDVSTDESYTQSWFMKFAGSKEGTFTPALFEVSQDEKDRIMLYVRQQDVPMLSVDSRES